MTEGKWALDKSQLDRRLLGDLAALIAVRQYLQSPIAPVNAPATLRKIEGEIVALIGELWPIG